jgi:hypothetical protein
MLRKTMIVLATAAALTGGLTADALARGGGGGHGGGFGGGAHMGGGGRGGFVRNPTTLLGSPAPQMPAFENRSPARVPGDDRNRAMTPRTWLVCDQLAHETCGRSRNKPGFGEGARKNRVGVFYRSTEKGL